MSNHNSKAFQLIMEKLEREQSESKKLAATERLKEQMQERTEKVLKEELCILNQIFSFVQKVTNESSLNIIRFFFRHHLISASSPGRRFIRRPCLFLLSWLGSSLQFQLQVETENGNVGTLIWLLNFKRVLSRLKSSQDFRFLPSSVVLLCNTWSRYIICSITDKRQGRLSRIICIGVCNCNCMFVVQNETDDGFYIASIKVRNCGLLGTKLMKWSAFRPHFSQKVSFSQS